KTMASAGNVPKEKRLLSTKIITVFLQKPSESNYSSFVRTWKTRRSLSLQTWKIAQATRKAHLCKLLSLLSFRETFSREWRYFPEYLKAPPVGGDTFRSI